MEIFDHIKKIAEEDENSYLKTARDGGKPIMGYFCSYVPEEIIHAAGFIPLSVNGSCETPVGSPFMEHPQMQRKSIIINNEVIRIESPPQQ